MNEIKPKTKNQRGRPKDPKKSELILKAATGLFMSLGLKSTSMDAVAKEAGVSKQTLYSHFAGKDALYSAVLHNKLEAYEFTQTPFESSGDLAADLNEIGLQMLNLLLDDEAVLLLKAVIAEGHNDKKTAQLFYDQGPEQIFAQLTDFLAGQDVPDARFYAHCFFNMLERDWHMLSLMGLSVTLSEDEINDHVTKCVENFMRMIAHYL